MIIKWGRKVPDMNFRYPSELSRLRTLMTCFLPDEEQDKVYKYSFFEIKYHKVDEDKFMEKMRLWYVDLEDTTVSSTPL